jgi:3-hydroxy-9,10-secoandrosta-1,3,5(10)-triene-9,17-dione monooxygenase
MLQTTTDTKAEAILARDEILRRAEALAPVLQERAAEAEALRRCPDATVRDYLDRDLLRICMPAPYGGYEHGYDVLCETSQILARGCGSQAWVHMVFADNALKLASYTAQAQNEVWGNGRVAKLSNCVTPTGKGKPVDGGVVWSGRHQFSSGVDQSSMASASSRSRCWCRAAIFPSSTTGT